MVYEENIIVGVLLPAYKIPSGSVVTKRNGDKEYILNRNINLYGEKKEIINYAGVIFLIPKDGPNKISCIPDDSILLWKTTEEEYYEYLKVRFEEENE